MPVPVTPSGKSGVQVEELPPAGPPTPVAPSVQPAPHALPPAQPVNPPVVTAPLPPPLPIAPQPAIGPAPKPPATVAGIVPEPAPRAGSRFLWPLEGKILSSFGPKKGGLHNDGINIAAARGTPVRGS